MFYMHMCILFQIVVFLYLNLHHILYMYVLLNMFPYRSIEGILDELRSSDYVDGVSLPQLNSVVASGYDSDSGRNVNQQDDVSNLPGAGKGSSRDGSRNTLPEILTAAVCFSTTGREWAAATTQGLQVGEKSTHRYLSILNVSLI